MSLADFYHENFEETDIDIEKLAEEYGVDNMDDLEDVMAIEAELSEFSDEELDELADEIVGEDEVEKTAEDFITAGRLMAVGLLDAVEEMDKEAEEYDVYDYSVEEAEEILKEASKIIDAIKGGASAVSGAAKSAYKGSKKGLKASKDWASAPGKSLKELRGQMKGGFGVGKSGKYRVNARGLTKKEIAKELLKKHKSQAIAAGGVLGAGGAGGTYAATKD